MLLSSKGGPSWIVAFLGNPGLKYEGTRHNAGFMTADALCKKKNIAINKSRFQALIAQTELGGEKVLLMKPQTYMNLSGEAVRQAAQFYRVPAERVLVISDDVALPQGKLRVRRSGSAGGHNGLKNIISHLGSDQFPRVKVGVGQKPHPDADMVGWVLGTFTGQDRKVMEEAISRAADAVTVLLQHGIDQAMSSYNG